MKLINKKGLKSNMLTTIQETTEVLEGGLLHIHAPQLKPHTMVTVVAVIEKSIPTTESSKIIKATYGLIKCTLIGDPMKIQRQLRNEWEDRFSRETSK